MSIGCFAVAGSGLYCYKLAAMKTLHVKKGENIIEEGKLSDCAYVIESGKVEVSKSGPEGKRRIISVLGDGDIVGEMGLIDGLPRSATVTALEDCTISVLSPEVFNSLAQHNPQALMPILKVLSTRLRATLKLVDDIQAGNVDKKSPIEDSI